MTHSEWFPAPNKVQYAPRVKGQKVERRLECSKALWDRIKSEASSVQATASLYWQTACEEMLANTWAQREHGLIPIPVRLHQQRVSLLLAAAERTGVSWEVFMDQVALIGIRDAELIAASLKPASNTDERAAA